MLANKQGDNDDAMHNLSAYLRGLQGQSSTFELHLTDAGRAFFSSLFASPSSPQPLSVEEQQKQRIEHMCAKADFMRRIWLLSHHDNSRWN